VTREDRALLREMLRRDLGVRWRGSFLGASWAVLQPLGWMVLYLLVFSVVLRIPPPKGAESYGFGLFLLAGLIPFLAFQEGVTRGTSVWMENSNLIKKMKVRPSLLVLTVCLSAVALELVGLIVIAAYESWIGVFEPSRLGWVLVGVALQIPLTLVPALLLAILAAFMRDLVLGLPFALTALFYLTPVVYPRELAPASFQPILDANPMAWLLLFFRAGLAGGERPPLTSLAWGAPLLVVATWGLARWADRLRPHIADVL